MLLSKTAQKYSSRRIGPAANSTGCHLPKGWATSGHTLAAGQVAVSPFCKVGNFAQNSSTWHCSSSRLENLAPGISENFNRENRNMNLWKKAVRGHALHRRPRSQSIAVARSRGRPVATAACRALTNVRWNENNKNLPRALCVGKTRRRTPSARRALQASGSVPAV
jgi:hypothetical protein